MANLLIALLVTILLVTQRARVKGTTLVASWIWTAVSIWSIAMVQFFESSPEVNYCASVLVFCPVMSTLGARRPQNRAWEFITASLWIILALPALEVLFARQGESFDVRGLRSWFFVVLIFISVSNIALSRFWISGILFGVVQTLLVSEFLPTWIQFSMESSATVALIVAAIAIGLACFLPVTDRTGRSGIDRIWLRYRDTFGGLWAVRTCESINAYARMQDWEIRLTWDAFVSVDGQPWADHELSSDSELVEKIHLLLKNQLRRFVDDAWIETCLKRV
ncbi:MAG TPA: hypothetical protein DHW38_05925 [Planctomycetaceae bacterium]|jgi:hypothetical protein|nr:hypothetical protein [Pirellulales bacterium]HCK71098.1 hypothetical protein [Planctomycetaceae bacterium]HCP84527.1 hypothetical protein [Planctomycetaceae bacterium]|tara:strand:- start:2325 stop:3161 length:837 start_codon:yes stop_codon:yes gene_type:complete